MIVIVGAILQLWKNARFVLVQVVHTASIESWIKFAVVVDWKTCIRLPSFVQLLEFDKVYPGFEGMLWQIIRSS